METTIKNREQKGILSKGNDFALFMTTTRLLHEPKLVVNARIVIVGASTTALSCVEQLLLNPGIDFRGLTLISSNGLEEQDSGLTGFFPIETDYDQWRLNRLMFSARVRLITSTVVDIDSKKKVVVLGTKKLVPYDHLVLTQGLQDQTPAQLSAISQRYLDIMKRRAEKARRAAEAAAEAEAEAAKKKEEGGNLEDEEEKVEVKEDDDDDETIPVEPAVADVSGILSVQDNSSINACFKIIEQATKKAENNLNILVYGSTPNALTMVRGVLNRGLRPENIFWMGEDTTSSVVSSEQYKLGLWHGGNLKVEKRAMQTLNDLGVTYLGVGKISTVRHEENILTGVHFKPGQGRRKKFPKCVVRLEQGPNKVDGLWFFPCRIVLCCGRPNINTATYNAIIKNSLVYDGRLVVDRNFRTCDSNILGAGTGCRFSRREGKTLPIECYNSVEVGVRLCEKMVDEIVGPELDGMETQHPVFKLPTTIQAIYPGEVRFLSSHLPSYVPGKRRKTKMIEHDRPQRYYQLVFSETGIFESFTYFGTEAIQSKKLVSMLGLPYTYLNGVLGKAEQKGCDFLQFLQAPWSDLLNHDQFQKERRVINNEVKEWIEAVRKGDGKSSEAEAIKSIMSAIKKGSFEKISAKISEALPIEQKKRIQMRLLKFIRRNANHCSSYGTES